MAAAAAVDKMEDKAQPTSPATARKRRRRVPATGASEDCHTCRKREIKCDRRRPYCSQCLEVSKDCSGYRTTLTWGVGVASRGKLRGMSLPVAKPAGQEASRPSIAQTHTRPRANTMHTNTMQPAPIPADNDGDGPRKRVRLDPLQTNVNHFPMQSPSMHTNNYFPQRYPSANSGYPNWQPSTYPPPQMHHPQFSFEHQFSMPQPPRRTDLFPLHTAVGNSFTGLPWSPNSPAPSGPSPVTEDMSPFANFPRAPGLPMTPQTLFSQGLHASPTNHTPHHDHSPKAFHSPHTAPPIHGMSVGSRSSRNLSHASELHLNTLPSNAPPIEERDSDNALRPNLKRTLSAPETAPNDQSESQNDAKLQAFSPNSPPHALMRKFQPRVNPTAITVSPRMWSLLEYYDKNICPVLVTFDNDNNPYRKHIMQLALQNAGVQNALAALVTNNMRMRSLKDVPRLDNGAHKEVISNAIGVPSPEEQHYKAKSIDFLNTQLADTGKAVDNSVLATLLILCLFHVCDSGFSKFKTQLAGVQKLLRMRSGMPRSDFHGWVEMFFAWFDVMTSAVNDRETQIQGYVLDLMDLSNNLGSVEEFSGCEGRLFKLIARLGRLNLLSQRRPVRQLDDSTSNAVTAAPPRVDSALDFFSFGTEREDYVADWNSFTPQQDNGSWFDLDQHDGREQFWREWNQLHDLLHAWRNEEFDGHSDSSPGLSEGQKAMLHMSESFRWAALLYMERLAHPTLPPSSANLQDLVHKSLHHIREIGTNSCVTKFMLWPLFISGTECVDKNHRELVRDRCIEIQHESGFYNNISSLEVLERVWKDHDEDRPTLLMPPRPCGQQAFHWRSCMDRVDGEYIVI